MFKHGANIQILASILFFCFQIHSGWAANDLDSSYRQHEAEIRLKFDMVPAGDFEASTQVIRGFPTEPNGKLTPPASVEVDMSTLRTGRDLRDRHMLETLDVTAFPIATVRDLTVTASTSPEKGEGKGTLSYHGQKVPVTFSFEKKGPFVHVSFKVKISDFKLGKKVAFKNIGVDDVVEVELKLPIEDKRSQAANPAL